MAEERLVNTLTKEARTKHQSSGTFGSGGFGRARFGTKEAVPAKEALQSNSLTKEART